ncbi:MAG: hypothetical protein ACI8TE_000008 [Francisella sp.]|jgi:hypothetical protein
MLITLKKLFGKIIIKINSQKTIQKAENSSIQINGNNNTITNKLNDDKN